MYNFLHQTVRNLSEQFLLEAKNSPQLLADMAAMERYMAESYGERVLIEVLQNADDAKATDFLICEAGGHVFIANNGKPFDEKDVLSICRSGASHKKRGETIGYRGVGFKSTTHLSTQIYIHSNECTFTFSKSLAAQHLGGIDESKVPAIRIPFLIEDVEQEIARMFQRLKQKGFTTIFVFVHADYSTLLREVEAVTADYFLFLRNINSVQITLQDIQVEGTIKRDRERIVIHFKNKKSLWYILSNGFTQIAFALNENEEIIPCHKEEAVFHCYLPTYEASPFLFKINGDFSTDPSRKHITLDEKTKEVIAASAELLFAAIKKAMDTSDENILQILPLLRQKNSFSPVALFFERQFQDLLLENWVKMQDGRLISPAEYIKKLNFLEEAEWEWIRQHTPLKHTLPKIAPELLNIFDDFLGQFSKKSYTISDWLTMLSDKEFVQKMPDFIFYKLHSHLIKQVRNKTIINQKNYNLDRCYFKVNQEVIRISDASKEELYALLVAIRSQLTSSEVDWFVNKFSLEAVVEKNRNHVSETENTKNRFGVARQFVVKSEQRTETGRIKKSITRWRAAEKQCVEFEEMQGNQAKDVSKQNLGYDVVSVTPDHKKRYIEVKSVKRRGDRISMTNNEYTAAHINGDNYFLCIIYEDQDDIVFEYIQNPLEKLKLEKVVRQWEWICEEYEGDVFRVKSE